MTYASFSDYREIRWYTTYHETHEGHEKNTSADLFGGPAVLPSVLADDMAFCTDGKAEARIAGIGSNSQAGELALP